jgi:hypothetical protein
MRIKNNGAFLTIFSIFSVSISYGIYPLSYFGPEKRCSGQNNPCWQKTNRKVLLNFVPPGSQDSFCFVFRKHFILADLAVLFFYVYRLPVIYTSTLHCIMQYFNCLNITVTLCMCGYMCTLRVYLKTLVNYTPQEVSHF